LEKGKKRNDICVIFRRGGGGDIKDRCGGKQAGKNSLRAWLGRTWCGFREEKRWGDGGQGGPKGAEKTGHNGRRVSFTGGIRSRNKVVCEIQK